MNISRRYIPSTTALIAFDAVARTGSFTKAGSEISLTQSAVSRQVQNLEDRIGSKLVERNGPNVCLTQAGKNYAAAIAPALGTIFEATIRASACAEARNLNLAILPTFGTRWLMPRIQRFVSLHPDITLNFTTRIGRFDFAKEAVDAAIYHGTPDWPGVDCTLLLKEKIVPVASPDFIDANPKLTATLIADLPRLAMKSRPTAWVDWFQEKGLSSPKSTEMTFEHFSTLAQACAAGLGIALMPEILIQHELSQNELVPIDKTGDSQTAYYLAAPKINTNKLVDVFRNWLLSEIGV